MLVSPVRAKEMFMAISGLVLILNDSQGSLEQVCSHLSRDNRFETGRPFRNRLPVVLTTGSTQEDREMCDWLESLHAVEQVEVVFVECDSNPNAGHHRRN